MNDKNISSCRIEPTWVYAISYMCYEWQNLTIIAGEAFGGHEVWRKSQMGNTKLQDLINVIGLGLICFIHVVWLCPKNSLLEKELCNLFLNLKHIIGKTLDF